MSEDEEPFCAICRNVLESDSYHKLSECNHNYHSECIIQWFRKGNNLCPLCADEGSNKRQSPYGSLRYDIRESPTEVTEARKFARTKKAPQKMKTIWLKLRKAEAEYREFRHEHAVWRRSVKDILKRNSSFRNKRWAYFCRIRGLKQRLVFYYPRPQQLIIIEKRIVKIEE